MGIGPEAGQGAGSREQQAQADVRGVGAGQRGHEGPDCKKTVGPEQKREAVRYLIYGLPRRIITRTEYSTVPSELGNYFTTGLANLNIVKP
jgi:hypothetical protein